jgi:LPXTG-motif cell wall-anchored protein
VTPDPPAAVRAAPAAAPKNAASQAPKAVGDPPGQLPLTGPESPQRLVIGLAMLLIGILAVALRRRLNAVTN